MSLTRRINTAEPVAVHAITLFHAIGIFDLIGSDAAVVAVYNGSEWTAARRLRIYYTPQGRPFIRKYRVRYYLDNFVRTGREDHHEAQ